MCFYCVFIVILSPLYLLGFYCVKCFVSFSMKVIHQENPFYALFGRYRALWRSLRRIFFVRREKPLRSKRKTSSFEEKNLFEGSATRVDYLRLRKYKKVPIPRPAIVTRKDKTMDGFPIAAEVEVLVGLNGSTPLKASTVLF